MHLDALLAAWGYPVLFLGTLLEGEAVVIAAAFLAHQGVLDLATVMLVALAGSVTGDQFWYWMGRRHGRTLLARRPNWSEPVDRVLHRIREHPVAVTLGFRFVYGLRIVTPVALGMSGLPAGLYTVLNLLGGLVWASAVGALGYLFGAALEVVVGELRHYERAAIVVLLVVGAGVWYALRRMHKGRVR